jgi:hypothetical protein
MTVQQLAVRVRAEFAEMPGLCLTPTQAQRLSGMDADLCQQVIEQLVNDAVLRWVGGCVRATHDAVRGAQS